MTRTLVAPITPISTPPRAGPSSNVVRVAAWKSAFASDTRFSSSPRSSGTITFCAAKYGAASAPRRNATMSSTANDSPVVQCRIGMTSMSGARAPSHSSIVRRAPSLPRSRPPGKPNTATPISSAATTKLIFVADPVVTSTNQGRAIQVICAPVVEITSAPSSATTERDRKRSRLLTLEVLLAHARHRREEQEQDAERAADHADPQRLAQPDHAAQDPAQQRADRTRAVVDEAVGAEDAGPQGLLGSQREHGVLVDVEDHDADARQELADQEHRDHDRVRAVRKREQHHRYGEQNRADDHRPADPDTPPHARRDDGADQRADRGDAEHDSDGRRAQSQLARREQDEDRSQEEIEEVDRAGAEKAASQQGVSEQVPKPLGQPGHRVRLRPLDLRLL